MDVARSSITIKEMGSIKRRQDGKEIKQEVIMKVYSDKYGEDAETELLNIKQRWDEGKNKRSDGDKDYPPQQLSSTVV